MILDKESKIDKETVKGLWHADTCNKGNSTAPGKQQVTFPVKSENLFET